MLSAALEADLPADCTQTIAELCLAAGVKLPVYESRSAEALEIALSILPITEQDDRHWLVRGAAKGGSLECFELALELSGLDLTGIDDIQFYAALGGNVDIMRRVLDSGVSLLDDGADFWEAVFSGSLELCRLLVSRGAFVHGNSRDLRRNTGVVELLGAHLPSLYQTSFRQLEVSRFEYV